MVAGSYFRFWKLFRNSQQIQLPSIYLSNSDQLELRYNLHNDVHKWKNYLWLKYWQNVI